MTTLRLFIKPDLQEQSLHDWIVLDRNGQAVRYGMSDLSELPICNETEVVIPTRLVSFIDIQLPEVNGKRLDAALPFIVEEFVLASPEEIHVMVASRAGERATLAIIKKAWMKECINALSAAKVHAKRMFPDFLLLALKEDAWTFALQGSSVLVRTSQTQGFEFNLADNDGSVAPYLLQMALNEKDQLSQPSVLVAYGELAKTVTLWASKLGIHGGAKIEHEWRPNRLSASFNLLQKEFSPPNDLLQSLYKFRACAVILAIILAMQCSLTLIDVGLQYRQSRQLDQEMIALFKASFPESTTIVDAPLQMQRKLDEIKHAGGEIGSSDFEPLLARISQTIGAIPAENLISMAYQDRKIIIAFREESPAQAEDLQKKLVSAGLIASLEKRGLNGSLAEVQLMISAGLE